MALMENLILVFVAGLITDLATGLGALPFFFTEDFSDEWIVGLWGLAAGIMVSASLFGLIPEGLASGSAFNVSIGLLIGVLLVIAASRLLEDYELDPGTFEEGDYKKMLLILGILTVHSFPEGVAIGVAFAELGFEGGIPLLGFTVPAVAIAMTIAISIHNIPEGLAISIPFKNLGLSKWKMMGAAIFSSLPQPIGAVIAFVFVREAMMFMPIGFGFAAGAMIYLVATEFVEEAREQGEDLENGGRRQFLIGGLAGFIVMIALFAVL